MKQSELKTYPKKSKSPIQAIRYFCFECMGWDRRSPDSGKPFEDVKSCTDPDCPLFDFRFGKNPFHSRAKVDPRLGPRPLKTDEIKRSEVGA